VTELVSCGEALAGSACASIDGDDRVFAMSAQTVGSAPAPTQDFSDRMLCALLRRFCVKKVGRSSAAGMPEALDASYRARHASG